MRLRTFTGLDKETQCACGCRQRMPANKDILVSVDMESFPRKRYIPGHAGNGYGSSSYAKREPKPKEETKPSPAPAPPIPVGPAPTPPVPTVEPGPSPTPKPSAGATSSLADNRPWVIVQVTASVGPYESVKVGMADFGSEGEALTAVRSRIAAEVSQEMDRQVVALRCMHVGTGSTTTKGVTPAPTTLSPAAMAGAPAKVVVGPEMAETRQQVGAELECDASVVLTVEKLHAGKQWLKAHGYDSFDRASLQPGNRGPRSVFEPHAGVDRCARSVSPWARRVTIALCPRRRLAPNRCEHGPGLRPPHQGPAPPQRRAKSS